MNGEKKGEKEKHGDKRNTCMSGRRNVASFHTISITNMLVVHMYHHSCIHTCFHTCIYTRVYSHLRFIHSLEQLETPAEPLRVVHLDGVARGEAVILAAVTARVHALPVSVGGPLRPLRHPGAHEGTIALPSVRRRPVADVPESSSNEVQL